MTTYTASGNGSLDVCVAALRVMLSQCAEVQSFLGAANEAAALALITANAADQPGDGEELEDVSDSRPRVLVFGKPDEGWSTTMDAIGSYDTTGTLEVVMERDLTPTEVYDDAVMIDAMQTTLGRVTDELWQQVWTDAAVAARSIMQLGPFRGDENTEADLGNRVSGVLEVTVGVGGNNR